MLNFYLKEKNAEGYCAINECYQLVLPFRFKEQSHWKEPLQKANFYASLFRVKLSGNKDQIKSNIEKITSHLTNIQLWQDTPKDILKDAIFHLSDKFSEDSESLFEVIRLVALIKLYDTKSSFEDFYPNFFEKIQNNADFYRFLAS
jgi:hypothetical protein